MEQLVEIYEGHGQESILLSLDGISAVQHDVWLFDCKGRFYTKTVCIDLKGHNFCHHIWVGDSRHSPEYIYAATR